MGQREKRGKWLFFSVDFIFEICDRGFQKGIDEDRGGWDHQLRVGEWSAVPELPRIAEFEFARAAAAGSSRPCGSR